MMDTVLRKARVPGYGKDPVDIGIVGEKITAIQAGLPAAGNDIDLAGRLVVPGLVDTHIHLDKSCIMERCRSEKGDLAEAIEQVSRAKAEFSEEDVATRAARTLEKCIKKGTGFIRTQVEVDPVVGLRGLSGVQQAIKEYAWAVEVEVCVFPQEGLLNYPGTEELLLKSLQSGVHVLGAAPYTDSDPHGQIDRIFQIAREFDVDIDMHLDFSTDPSVLDTLYVCDKTEEYGWSGRVTIGHVTKLSALAPADLELVGRRLADAGVALTVMPSTDLFLMGRDKTENIPRGIAPAHQLMKQGVVCSISTNNVLNPFTPFGDGSLLRMANLYANAWQLGTKAGLEDCFRMISTDAASIMSIGNYELGPGCPASFVVLDCGEPASAVSEIAHPVLSFKNGKQVLSHPLPTVGTGS